MTTEGGRNTGRRRRWIQVAASLVVVGIIFFYALPKITDISQVRSALGEMTPIELGTLALIALWNIATYWLVMMSSLPGSNVWQAMKVNLISTSVSNTLPGGGAIGMGVTYSLYSTYGFSRSEIGLSILVTGIWNNFVKLGMPVVALALLAVTGNASSALLVASGVGVLLLAAAIAALALALRSDRMARRIGEVLGRALTWFRRRFRKSPVTGWGDSVVALRRDAIGLLRDRWLRLTVATLVSHISLFAVLLLALRHVGIAENEVSWIEVLAAFAFIRLLSAIPITPGGLGVVELGLIGALVTAGGDRPGVVAAVLVFRALTYLLPIPLGAIGYIQWKRRSRPRLTRALAGSLVALLLFAGCTSSSIRTAAPTEVDVVIGSYPFTESRILAHIYAAALENAGLEVDVEADISSRELMIPALEQGIVDFVPEYQGTLGVFLANAAPDASQKKGLTEHLRGRRLVDLRRAPAENRNEIVVMRSTARRLGLNRISDLERVASQLIFGGPPECPTRPLCLLGLRRTYGLSFEDFQPIDTGGPLTLAALRGGEIDIGLLFTTDPALADTDLVVLEDDLDLQPEEHIVPVIREDRDDLMQQRIRDAVDTVSARLSTPVLRALNRLVDSGGSDPERVATRWFQVVTES
ncbi:MAG TPA: glycine betaine ABC transporter substrate-binding protein [Actinomycetota bacterium]|nr:glycine betaine ABC transporter substrate-binding protein [Actinomycetota bacterium]